MSVKEGPPIRSQPTPKIRTVIPAAARSESDGKWRTLLSWQPPLLRTEAAQLERKQSKRDAFANDQRPPTNDCHYDDSAGYAKLMRAVLQRVSQARVTVGEEVVGEISHGLLVLLGVAADDIEADAIYLADKILGLRIFPDNAGKMNLSVTELGGSLLAVSQFTLYGDVRRGRRPSFDSAAAPTKARQLYEFFVERIRSTGLRCETGRFQEMMNVELTNDGPVTILLDSKKEF